MNPNLKQSLWHWLSTAVTTAFFSLTAGFVRTSVSANSHFFHGSYFFEKFSSTLAILRFLQGITTASTTFVLHQTLELIQWSLVSRSDGMLLPTLLSISPTTGIFGMWWIVRRGPEAYDRAWAACRLILIAMIWLAGFLLFVKTHVAIVYDPFLTFSAVAGIGTFNGSFVGDVVDNVNGAITYQILVYAYNFVTNSQFSIMASPVSCTTGCESYIFPGALWSLDRSPPGNSSPDAVVTIYNSPAIQMDFMKGLRHGDAFNLSGSDCTLYGENGNEVGIIFCMAKSEVHDGSIIAGVFVCRGGVYDGGCVLNGLPLNISTTLTVYSLLATSSCALNNNSILSISDLGNPTHNDIDMDGLNLALRWLLNYTAERLPAISSIPYLFWDAQPGLGYHDWSIVAYQSLKSLIAFPIWEFGRNNFGDPRLEPLPTEFEISASVCHPYYKIILNASVFYVYLVLQSTVLMFCWGVIIWRLVCRLDIEELSSYPLVDFATKLVENGTLGEHRSIFDLRKKISWNADSTEILRTLKNVKLIRRTKSEWVALEEIGIRQVDEVAQPLDAAREGALTVEAGGTIDLVFAEGGDDEPQNVFGGHGVESGERFEGVERVEEVEAVAEIEAVKEVKAVEEIEAVKDVKAVEEIEAVEEVEAVEVIEGVEGIEGGLEGCWRG